MSDALEAAPRIHAGPEVGRQRGGPSRFFGRILLFFAPIIGLALALELALWFTGETWPISRVIAKQSATPGTLFMRGLLDQGFYRYKYLQIARREPRVLVLGSSRVMEFRAEMFGVRSNEFFNAGGMIQDLSDLSEAVTRLTPEHIPEVILLGLDLWWFNGHKPLLHGFAAGVEREGALDWQEHVRVARRLKSGKTRRAVTEALRVKNHNLGIEARTLSNGFRADGSMHYSFPLPVDDGWKFVDRESPPIYERIRQNSAQFTPSPEGISADRLSLLARSLDELRAHGVTVLGFLPPFSSESAGFLQSSSAHSNLWAQVRVTVPQLFHERGLAFVDASMPDDLGANDSCMIDGIHAAETFQLRVLDRFMREPRLASHFPGLQQTVEASLASPATNPWQPDYGPFFGVAQ